MKATLINGMSKTGDERQQRKRRVRWLSNGIVRTFVYLEFFRAWMNGIQSTLYNCCHAVLEIKKNINGYFFFPLLSTNSASSKVKVIPACEAWSLAIPIRFCLVNPNDLQSLFKKKNGGCGFVERFQSALYTLEETKTCRRVQDKL